MLAREDALATRLSLLNEPHIAPLTKFVEDLRKKMGVDAQIPYFDPWDGGTDAEVLFLLEAPGPKARNSGFISRNNPDETAKNFFEISVEARLVRRKTATWNIVPWYIGTDTKIRAAKASDIEEGKKSLTELISLLPNLRAIVLLGKKAQMASVDLKRLAPSATLFECPHPSPMYVNRSPENRNIILGIFKDVYSFLEKEDRG